MRIQKINDSIPLAIKIYGGVVALLGLLFVYACYFNPAQISPGAVLDNTSIKLAFYTAGALAFSLSVGLALAIISNRPKSMALILIVRVVVALQDLAIAVILGLGVRLVIFQVIISLLGIAAIIKLFSLIRTAEHQAV